MIARPDVAKGDHKAVRPRKLSTPLLSGYVGAAPWAQTMYTSASNLNIADATRAVT